MRCEEFDEYLRGLGHEVKVVIAPGGQQFTVIHGVTVTKGPRAGRSCDVAIGRVTTDPMTVPSAIHTRPALARMDWQGPLKTRESELGPEWQYWSRRFDHPMTAKNLWAHVLTVLSENVA